MDYTSMILDAQKKGLTSENKMWQSFASLSAALNLLKESNPKEYWKIVRKQHAIIYDGHYTEEFAVYDVDSLHWTDNTGMHKGAYWTIPQIKEATSSLRFPEGVNDWDKFVAFNAAYSDMAGDVDDATIIKLAHRFYFADEDWHEESPNCTKIWDYMTLAHT